LNEPIEATFVDDVVRLALSREEPENLATCEFDDAFGISTVHPALHDELGSEVDKQAEEAHAAMLFLQKYGVSVTIFHWANPPAAFAGTQSP
jgi:hypothetical protein